MSGLLEGVSGGATALRGPLRARLDFARDCADVIHTGLMRTQLGQRSIDEQFKAQIYKVLDWGILNQTQVAALCGVSRVTLSRTFADMERRPGTLRGKLTLEGMLLLIQAMRMEYAGESVDYDIVVVEMINSDTSPNVARALCGLTRTQLNGVMKQHGDGGLRPEVRPSDQGHPRSGEEISWDLLEDPTGNRPEPSPKAAPAPEPGDVPRAPASDTDTVSAAAEDEAVQPKQPLLDPATLQGEELRIALEQGRAWYPEIENPIDESGDSYLQGKQIAPPDDFLANFEALEQAEE